MAWTSTAGLEPSILEGVHSRDAEAFTKIVAAYDSDLRRFAFIVARDAELADDAVQESWERLWSEPPMLRDADRLQSWLLTVTANNVRQRLRRLRAGERAVERMDEGPAQPSESDWANGVVLRELVAALPPRDRELVALHDVLGLNASEISPIVKLRPGAVRTRLYRIHARLRKEFAR
jgi:RNA polymerase sigma-70 factor (ECF subfamily)